MQILRWRHQQVDNGNGHCISEPPSWWSRLRKGRVTEALASHKPVNLELLNSGSPSFNRHVARRLWLWHLVSTFFIMSGKPARDGGAGRERTGQPPATHHFVEFSRHRLPRPGPAIRSHRGNPQPTMNENKVDEEIFERGVSADGPKSCRI